MTDPVDTDALRDLQALSGGILSRNLMEGSGVWKINRDVTHALGAAADEVDRLRANLGTQERVNADLVVAWDAMREDRNRLRKSIEEAPHDPFGCGLVRSQQRTGYCNCWKADALG